MTKPALIPLIVLGGSDRKASVLPPEGAGKHPITGYKGVDIVLGGRPLVSLVAERFRGCGLFGPILVAGPARLYEGVPGIDGVIDTDASVAENIMRGLDHLAGSGHEGKVAVTSTDLVPAESELVEVVADYREHRNSDMYFPLIRISDDLSELGTSDWKPNYRIVPRRGAKAVRFLPSHLAIFDPRGLRMAFLESLVRISYQTRNRPLRQRRFTMIRQILVGLLYQDFLHVLGGRFPSLTYSVLRNGLKVARGLRRGQLLVSELEKAAGQVGIKWRHRKRHPDRGVCCPILGALSLARDIDTQEEAVELGGALKSPEGRTTSSSEAEASRE